MNSKLVLEQAQALLKAAKENPEQFQELEKKYMGFKAVEAKAKASGARNPAAVAAAAGRKKYGKEAFQHAAATGHKMGKTDAAGLELSEKAPAANGGQEMKKDAITDQMGVASSEPSMAKDDKPHAPNSPQDKAHDVSEHSDTIAHAMKILDTPERQHAMFAHLRTLCDPSQARSEENKEAGMAEGDKKMDKTEMLKAAKDLLELAKKEPQKFEEMAKAMAAPAPAPAAPKAPAAMAKPAAPKMPGMAKPSMRMSKDEIKADLAKPFTPKHKKMGC